MIRKTIIGTGHLKKYSYNILKKYHEITDRKKFERIFAVKDVDDYCVVTVVKNIEKIMQSSLSDVQDSDCKIMAEDYLAKLHHLANRIDECGKNQSTLHEGFVSSVLKAHTNLFNRMIEVKEKFIFTEDSKELWDKSCDLAKKVWTKF